MKNLREAKMSQNKLQKEFKVKEKRPGSLLEKANLLKSKSKVALSIKGMI